MKSTEILKQKLKALRKEAAEKHEGIQKEYLENILKEVDLSKYESRVTIRNYSCEIEIYLYVRNKERRDLFSVRIRETRDWDDLSKIKSKEIEANISSMKFTLDEKDEIERLEIFAQVVKFFKENEKKIWKSVDKVKEDWKEKISSLSEEMEEIEKNIRIIEENEMKEEKEEIEKEYIKEGQVIVVSDIARTYAYSISRNTAAKFMRLGKLSKNGQKIEMFYKEYVHSKDSEYFRADVYVPERMTKRNVPVENVVNYIYRNRGKYYTHTKCAEREDGTTDFSKDLYFKCKRIGFDFDLIGTDIENEEITKEEYIELRKARD